MKYLKFLTLLPLLFFAACIYKSSITIEDSNPALSLSATGTAVFTSEPTCMFAEGANTCTNSFDVFFTATTPPTDKFISYSTNCNATTFTSTNTKTTFNVTLSGDCAFTVKLVSRAQDCSTFPCIYYINPIHADMGGIGNTGTSGADSLCTKLGPSNGTTFKALLASSTRHACTSYDCATGGASENLDWPLSTSTTYYRPDGTEIGTTDSSAIWINSATNSIAASTGTELSYWHAWTKGKKFRSDANCSDWTTTSGITNVGNAASSLPLDDVGTRSCNSDYGLVCVATGTNSTTKRIFVTATTYTGNLGGVTGADAKCAADTNKPSNGTYKALISDGTARIACTTANCSGGATEHTGWVLSASKQYTRADGTVIGTTNSAGIFDFTTTLTSAVSTTTANVWTGLEQNWTSSTNDCVDYTSAAGPGGNYSAIGNTNATDATAIKKTLASGCENSYALYCVEQ